MRERARFPSLLAAVLVAAAIAGCGDGGSSSTSGTGTGGQSGGTGGGSATGTGGGSGTGGDGTGGTGTGASGGGGAAPIDYGPPATQTVSAGQVSKNANHRMVFTLGQPTQNQIKMTSPGHRLQGGLIGANGSLP